MYPFTSQMIIKWPMNYNSTHISSSHNNKIIDVFISSRTVKYVDNLSINKKSNTTDPQQTY